MDALDFQIGISHAVRCALGAHLGSPDWMEESRSIATDISVDTRIVGGIGEVTEGSNDIIFPCVTRSETLGRLDSFTHSVLVKFSVQEIGVDVWLRKWIRRRKLGCSTYIGIY